MRPSPWLRRLFTLSAWCAAVILALIGLFILAKSLPFFSAVGFSALWQDDGWVPTEGAFNLVPMVAGSLLVTLGAVILAAPAGVMLALWGRYYAPAWLAAGYRGGVELLAGIPSVVYGFWGLVVLVPWLAQRVPPGASLLAGILILALMILPLVVLSADEAFGQLPASWLQAADALALSRWRRIRTLVLPQSVSGILSGTLLQTGRALGETMAVVMVCGNIVQIPGSLFAPIRTLTANIALEMSYAVDRHLDVLFVAGLLLIVLVVAMVLTGHRLKERFDG